LSPPQSSDDYLDEQWLLMRWDSAHQCVIAEWQGFATREEFQGALTRALEVIREKKAVSFVNDTRRLELVSDEDQRWVRYTWAPLAIAAGVKRIAVVIAKHGLSKMAIEGMFQGRPALGRNWTRARSTR
jgi:hypothetical protein